MSQCPYCKHELPKMDMNDAMEVLRELKAIPGFMERLGQQAAEAYMKSGRLKQQ